MCFIEQGQQLVAHLTGCAYVLLHYLNPSNSSYYTVYDVVINDRVGEAVANGARDFYKMQEKALNGGFDQNGVPLPIVCFNEGTLVYAETGLKPIEKINVGEKIYSYSFKKKTEELSKVRGLIKREATLVYEMATKNEMIIVTSEHPFYVLKKGWMKARDLKVGYKIMALGFNAGHEITRIKTMKYPTTVYNLDVNGNSNYFVTQSKLLVHNKRIIEFNRSVEKKK